MDARQLSHILITSEFTYDSVAQTIGESGLRGLARNSTIPARAALADRTDALATLIRLFVLEQAVPRAVATDALDDVALWPELVTDTDPVQPLVSIRPYASPDDGASGLIVADLTPGIDHSPHHTRPDYVLAVSPASTQLAEMAIRRPVNSALDLGTGCGVQSLHLVQHARRVVATDLNPRALDLARLTFALNHHDVDTRLGSLFEPVAEETFDLIISNPPYVMAPPDVAGLTYREGGMQSDELVRRVVVAGAQHLAPQGTLQVLANWAVVKGQSWQDRISGWLADTDCAAHVVEREFLDPYEYIEIWLADAGIEDAAAYAAAYQHWLHYFDAAGILGVSMGWIHLRKPPVGTTYGPSHRYLEAWPHPVHWPVGPALDSTLDAVIALADLSDDDILDATWLLAPFVDEERVHTPGEEHPRRIVVTHTTGLMRARMVDAAIAATIGACDGDLTLRQILMAIAQIMELDADELVRKSVVELRGLIRDGILTGRAATRS